MTLKNKMVAVVPGAGRWAAWDLSKRVLVTRVKSPEKYLLYSMRMWGDSVRELLVASVAILNECSPVDAEFQVTKFCRSASQSRQC